MNPRYHFGNLPSPETDIEADKAFFFEHLPEWLEDHYGEWAVIRNQTLLGIEPTENKAIKLAVRGVNPETTRTFIQQIFETGEQGELFDP